MSRRDLMKLGLFSSAALMLPIERVARTKVALTNRIPTSKLPQPFTIPFKTPPVLVPERQSRNHDYYAITQRQASTEILPGLRTDVWGYNGISPGPTIVNQQGRPAVMQQTNELPAVHPTLRYNVWTSTHLHGSASKPQYDGYASDITDVGHWKDYVYPNFQEARTMWYHDHAVHLTAQNSYMGLAAMYILHDPHELSLPIPHGTYDVPLVIRDAMFESNGQLLFDDNEESGVYGDVILVNGVPWPSMPVERRKYRFRVVNAAITRSFELKLDTGEPLTVIGTDGGLMPHPMPVGRLKVGNAERYEVVIDFSKYKIGQRVVMENVSPKNNIDYETTNVVMAFDVVADASDTSSNEVPYDLNPRQHVMGLQESDSVRTRHFEFERGNSRWQINGTAWADVVNSDYKKVLANPGFNDVEIWELKNSSGGWFHPVHIHLVDFKILDRNGRPPEDNERGPKDVVYVGEGETVRVIMRFAHEQGRFMIHCHNLVHEDHDMMAQFVVGEDSADYDPIYADQAAQKPVRPLSDRWDDPDEDEDEDEDDDDDDSSGGSGSANSASGSRGGGDRLSFDESVLPSPNAGGSVPQAKGSSVQATCAPKRATPVKKKATPVRKKAKRKIAKPKSRPTMSAGRRKAAGASKPKTCKTPAKRKAPAKRKIATPSKARSVRKPR